MRKIRIAVFTASLAIAAYFGWRCTLLSGASALVLGVAVPLLFFFAEMREKWRIRKTWQ